MALTGAILPLRGCLVILIKFSCIQSKAKINIYTLQKRKEYDNTTLARQRAETKLIGEMKQPTADGQIHLSSLKHHRKTTGKNVKNVAKDPVQR